MKDHHITYQVLTHQYSEGMYNTSVAAYVSMRKLNKQLKRTFRFVEEDHLADFFTDCSLGAVPAVGQAYNLPVICEDLLYEESEVYLEGGDHEALIQLDKSEFSALMKDQSHMTFSEGRNVDFRESGTRH